MRQSTINILAISRGSEFSPNHITNDAAIFNIVVKQLELKGCHISLCSESEFVSKHIEADYIFDMARDEKTILRLKEMEKNGTLVINSAFGIENCRRKRMTELLIENKIPHPKSYIVTPSGEFKFDKFPYWIKRGNSHAIVKDDVCFVDNKRTAEKVFLDFSQRGIDCAIINEHIKGDLIKFYGVAGTDFFYWFYPSPCSKSKFGLEKINGYSKGIHFEESLLREYATKASNVLNVPIYGGDCVISDDGSIKIIDFNDWPSFARCRDEAGKYIAEYIYKAIKQFKTTIKEQ